MTEDSDNYSQSSLSSGLTLARELIRKGALDEALGCLDRLDRKFPHNRNIIALRRKCFKGSGTKQYEYAQIREKRPVEFSRIWDEDSSQATTGTKFLKGRLPEFPSLGREPATVIQPPHGFDYGPEKSDLLDKVVLSCLMLAFIFGVLVQALAGVSAGEHRRFVGMDFVWIPPAPPPKKLADGGLAPKKVEYGSSEGFWLGQYEVTSAQWRSIARGEDLERAESETDLSPRSNVSAEAANSLIYHLNRRGEGHFRLPTLAEWKHAALEGGSLSSDFAENSSEFDDHAWYSSNSGGVIHAVGSKEPNAWGLYDIRGNLSEWCLEVDAAKLQNRSNPWQILAAKVPTIVQGGSAISSAIQCSVALGIVPENTSENTYFGLRLVREPGTSTHEDVRINEFPIEQSLGMLYVGDRELGRALGQIPILRHDDLGLRVSIEGLEIISALRFLEPDALAEIDMSDLEAGDAHLENIRHLTGLKHLNLSKTKITDDGLRALRGLHQLAVLDVSETQITGSGLEILSSFKKLRSLSAENVGEVLNRHILALHSLETLRYLNLEGNEISPFALMELQISLPSCEVTPLKGKPTTEQSLQWARINGKYSALLRQFASPQDLSLYGRFYELGYMSKNTWKSHTDLPGGYWVYVDPYWYIWNYSQNVPKPRWGAERATGTPNVTDDSADSLASEVWAPAVRNGARDWLMVEFEKAVVPRALWIYASEKVDADLTLMGYNLRGLEVLVRSPGPVTATPEEKYWRYTLSIQDLSGKNLTREERKLNRIKIVFDWSKSATFQAETMPPSVFVDAVALVDGVIGTQWASNAVSSGILGDSQPEHEETERSETERAWVRPAPGEIRLRGVPAIIELLLEYEKESSTQVYLPELQLVR